MNIKGIVLTIFCLLVTLGTTAFANGIPLNLFEAIDLAFAENKQYQLAIWETQLLSKEQKLLERPRPKIDFTSTPLSLGDRGNKFGQGTLTLSIPLNDYTRITSDLNIGFDKWNPTIKAKGSVSLNYRLFAPEKPVDYLKTEDISATNNALVLDVTGNFIALRKYLDNLDLEQFRLEYLKQAYQGAEITNDIGQLQQLQNQIYNTEQKLQDLYLRIGQTNRKLTYLLNQPEMTFIPLLKSSGFILETNWDELTELALLYSDNRISALSALEDAEMEMASLKQSSGWDVETAAKLEWNPNLEQGMGNRPTTWSISITASKQLYPISLELERAELKVAQARLRLANLDLQISDEIRQRLETMQHFLEQKKNIETNISNENQELATSVKYYKAGLVTELKLLAHRLNLLELNITLEHTDYDYLLNLLQLWEQCGFNLEEKISLLVEEVER